ncbi:hypothetical protein DFH06DRAFT_1266270 [Mycena polygramma]|nr:hypothetical protein DFH06DRAFT_1266270 [Mycena polygramma]
MAAASGSETNPKIPEDVRTAVKQLSIEPVIKRSICCPKCYRAYSFEELPQVCLARQTPGCRPCNTPLWVERQTRAGPKIDFESWLAHFLSRPGMEELLQKSTLHVPNPDKMTSIWDSPAWQSLGTFYIDWFNPFTNKIAGKHASCGAIIAMWHLEENTFFAGITPPPKEPTVTTMSALLDPVMAQFEGMWHGKMVPTYNHPEGDMYRVAIIVAIGDLLALKKALGFASHASTNFCSMCKLKRCDIDQDTESFEPRRGWEVLRAAKEWLMAQTQAARKAIFAKHGVRPSSFNTLTYRDPVKHTVLGVMHNWIEGILQHHCRLKWGIGSDSPKAGKTKIDPLDAESSSDSDVEMMDVDDSTIATELEDLHQDSFIQNDATASLSRRASFRFIAESDDKLIEQGEEDEEDEEADDEEEIYESEKPSWKVFDKEDMDFIHEALADIVIPSWIDRPPTNLGEKSHGKLKADNWFVLFIIFFPLIMPELWHNKARREQKLLDNLHDLVSATNTLCSYTTSPAEADTYTERYRSYLASSQTLFPGLSTRPNHHYARHNGKLLKWWGPLIKLGEFFYESHNGRLQKIKTNNHMCKPRFQTMKSSTYTCNRGARLDNASPDAMRILSRRDPMSMDSQHPQTFSPAEETAFNGSGTVLDASTYELIFNYWNCAYSPPYIRAAELTYDLMDAGVSVFPSRAVQRTNFDHKTRNFTTFKQHIGGSSISFRHPSTGRKDLGYIWSIWTQVLQGQR